MVKSSAHGARCVCAALVDLAMLVAARSEIQWIGLRENLQESPIFNGKIYGFL